MDNFDQYTNKAIKTVENYKDMKEFKQQYERLVVNSTINQGVVKKTKKSALSRNKVAIAIALAGILAVSTKIKYDIKNNNEYISAPEEILLEEELNYDEMKKNVLIHTMSEEEAAINYGFSGFIQSLQQKGFDMPMIYGFFIENGYDYRTKEGDFDLNKAYEEWFSNIQLEKTRGTK